MSDPRTSDKPCSPNANEAVHPNRFQSALYWLAGAHWDTLRLCPAAERERVAVLGSTILVPTSMAFLGMFFFAKSRFSDPPFFPVLFVSLLWAFVILNTDRTLIALYRPFQPLWRRLIQVLFRLGLASVVSLAIAFPFCLDQYRPAIRFRYQTELQAKLNDLRNTEAQGRAQLREELVKLRDTSEVDRRKLNGDYTKLREGLSAQLPDLERSQLNPELFADSKMEDERRRVTATDFVAPASGTTLNIIARIDVQNETLERLGKLAEEQQAMHRRLVEATAREELGLPNEFYPEAKKPGDGPRLKDIKLRDARVAGEIRRLELALKTAMAELASEEEALAKGRLTDRNAYLDSLSAKRTAFLDEAKERDKTRRDRLAQLNTQIETADAAHAQLLRKLDAHTQTREEDHSRAQQRHDDTFLPPISRLEGKINGIFDPMEETIGLYKVIFLPPPDMPEDAKLQFRWLAGLFQFCVVFGTLFLLDLIPIVVKLLSRAGPYDILVEHSEFVANLNWSAFEGHFRKHGSAWPGQSQGPTEGKGAWNPADAEVLLRPHYAPPPTVEATTAPGPSPAELQPEGDVAAHYSMPDQPCKVLHT